MGAECERAGGDGSFTNPALPRERANQTNYAANEQDSFGGSETEPALDPSHGGRYLGLASAFLVAAVGAATAAGTDLASTFLVAAGASGVAALAGAGADGVIGSAT